MIMVHRLKKKNILVKPPKELLVDVKIPNNIDTYKKLSKHLWKTYNIDVDLSEDNYGDLFWNPDLRSFMGWVEDFGGGWASLRILPKYYSVACKDEWEKLIKNSEIGVA